jgi:phosphoacetylglucosamine mutase
VLLDGDKIAALSAVFLRQLLAQTPAGTADSINTGVVQTAYANGASTTFITQQLGLKVCCTNTGKLSSEHGCHHGLMLLFMHDC